MKILAVETSTDACSAALLIDEQVKQAFAIAPRKHTQLILNQIDSVLAEADIKINDIDAIAFARGPGAFTGLRIAAGLTQGIALACDIPAIAVSTLAAMAQQSFQRFQTEKMYVALDARMNQVYWGEYYINKGFAELQAEELVISPKDLAKRNEADSVGIGSGWQAYQAALQERVQAKTTPDLQAIHPAAKQVAQLAAEQYKQGNLLSAEQVQPVYLRNKVAQTLQERGL